MQQQTSLSQNITKQQNPIKSIINLQKSQISKMIIWVFFILLPHIIIPTNSAFGVGVGVGVGYGNVAGGGVTGGNGGGIHNRNPSGFSNSKLESAYKALQAWKSAISNDPLGILTNWVGPDVCSYKGIFCADYQDDIFIAGIDLNHGNLQGILVKELSLLTDISIFHLNSNRFTGSVPDSFEDLSNLQELDLSNNHFSGPFPLVTLYIPNLVYLDLRFNNFSGPIPDFLFNKKLDAIFLNNNQFTGQVPDNLGNSPASVINLANNKFTGTIPISLGFMAGSNLKEILLLNNQLTGCIPEGVGMFTEMQVLDLSHNTLMGHLPDAISCLNEIEVMNLGHNKLSGVLPDVICRIKSLMNLSVEYNYFSGFDEECTKLNERNVGFDFSLNCIAGRDMQRPHPECNEIPGGGLNCFRIPVQPLDCSAGGGYIGVASLANSSSSNP